MEAELRAILSATLAQEEMPEMDLATAIRRRMAPLGGVDLPPHPQVQPSDPPEFE